MRIFRSILAASLLLSASTGASAGQSLEEILAAPHRSAENRARDVYRHPLETLKFFGLKPDQQVVEVWPGGGWYTEIIAPYLRDSGQYIAAGFVTSGADAPKWRIDMMEKYAAWLTAQPKLFGKPLITQLGIPDAFVAAPAGSADLVLTFRNVHNWMKAGYEAQMFKSFFDALKPGGVLGVVEHRAKPGTSLDKMKGSGYVTEAHVIELAKAAGFQLDASSEINANPKDGTVHPEGVWTLPPTLRLGDKDREKYLAIGESDRMTLRFVKPKT
ncbi:MAG: class I SAM-dependent methyltransferase [Panacagrimonas sp.]